MSLLHEILYGYQEFHPVLHLIIVQSGVRLERFKQCLHGPKTLRQSLCAQVLCSSKHTAASVSGS